MTTRTITFNGTPQQLDKLRLAPGVVEIGPPMVHPYAHVLVGIAEGREIETVEHVRGAAHWVAIEHDDALETIAKYSCGPGEFRVKSLV